MDKLREVKLENMSIADLSLYTLLRYADRADFLENDRSRAIAATSLTINSGVFTAPSFPETTEVTVDQVASGLITTCTCNHSAIKLCPHQAEVIHGIHTRPEFRIFFDAHARKQFLKPHAQPYGLGEGTDLDAFFELQISDNRLEVRKRIKSLVDPTDRDNNAMIVHPLSKGKRLAKWDNEKRKIVVLGRHRYFKQVVFYLMEVGETKTGALKYPIDNVDPKELLWLTDDTASVKFYAALQSLQQKYTEDDPEQDVQLIQHIVENPLALDFYYHDRSISDKFTPRSLQPAKFSSIQAEIHLTVSQNTSFYKITGELQMAGLHIPFHDLHIKDRYFLFHQNQYYFLQRPELLSVVAFFKKHDHSLWVHATKYPDFLQHTLGKLADIVHIDYTYIHKASEPERTASQSQRQSLLYLQQEGAYITLRPVMKYGQSEVAVYAKTNVFQRDEAGNTVEIPRDQDAELRLISLIMRQHPDFSQQLQEPEYFYLHQDKFLDDDWFLMAFQDWKNADITILGFNELKPRNRPQQGQIRIEINSGTDWFNAHIKLRYGQQTIPLKQLQRAIRNKQQFIELDDGSQGLLPQEWLQKISHYLYIGKIQDETIRIPKVGFSNLNDPTAAEEEIWSTSALQELEEIRRTLLNDEPIPEVPVPDLLQAQIRTYQQEGLNWLMRLNRMNFGGCLADDMGLGKTLQVIAFLLAKREKRNTAPDLVILPTSLLFNWQQEFARFAPSLRLYTHHGSARQKAVPDFDTVDVVLTTYGTIVSDISIWKDMPFDAVILDESQAIKNPSSARYKAVCALRSRIRFVLTGTPIENNTTDLYGQLSFACPGLLGSRKYFKDVYAVPIDQFDYRKRMQELQQKVQPFILRRTKKQVATELPEKTEMSIFCEMNTDQQAIYDNYEEALRNYVEATDQEGLLDNRMNVLAGLTKLRQIANAPFLLKEGHAKNLSAKLELLMEHLITKSKAHKILVFSQFVGMLDLVKEQLEQSNIGLEYLTGQTTNRSAVVHRFQNDPEIRVFLISLKAGGVGLNLTEADYVYLIDPWWNTAAENQAIDRSYRIGQSKHVVAVRLICSGTIEEKIVKLQQRKSDLVQQLVRPQQSSIEQLSKQELLGLL